MNKDIPTREQVEALKTNWMSDPCWDIYDSEGFEAYRDELRAFQDAQEIRWRAEAIEMMLHKAENMGLADNLTLAAYIVELERRIKALEDERELA